MRDWVGKRYWIVGASEGLGRALAMQLSRTGAEVILSARSEGRLEALAGELSGRSSVVPCDVRDTASVARAAEIVGPVDGLVYVAGVQGAMKATEWDAGKAEVAIDVNLTGCLRVLGRVLPGMVERGRGHIMLIGSLAAYRGMPGNLINGASKAALLNLAQSMRSDLDGTGVEVQIANPGRIRTRLTEGSGVVAGMMEPVEAARMVFEQMNGDAPVRAMPYGAGLVVRLGRFLPESLWRRLVG